MIKDSNRGMGKVIALIAIAMLGLFFVALILGGPKGTIVGMSGTSSYQDRTNPLLSFLTPVGSGTTNTSGNNTSNTNKNSVYAGSLTVSLGNSTYQSQTYKEYVTIRNSGNQAIDITGMVLKNSKGDRPVENSGNSAFYPTPETAVIGRGAKLLAPSGIQVFSDIILGPGDTAYVITGNPAPAVAPINASFRENKCTGFLSKKYSFEPRLNSSCPIVLDSASINTITKQCSDYVQYLQRCENPEDTKISNDKLKLQTTICQNFVKSRMSYPACVTLHYNDSDFYGHNWYVFLGKGKEMWTQSDTITLMDAKGNIIAKSSW
jgi:hypothetical protein